MSENRKGVTRAARGIGTARFLCSDQTDYMSGKVLIIDGGMVLQ